MKLTPTISEIERDRQEVEKLTTQLSKIVYKYEKGVNQSLEEYTKDSVDYATQIFNEMTEDNLTGVS